MKKAGLTLNRIAVLLTALAALAAALAPVLADLDWESTAGIIAGLSSITAVVYKWLDGWQKWEGRQPLGKPAPPLAVGPPPTAPEEGTTYQPPPDPVA